MEYLDPEKRKRYRVSLFTGYFLVTIGIAVGILILVWQAFGYSVQDGQVVQDGMVFISSQPNPASIYINGVLNSATTNTRLTIPEGVYRFELTAPGYRPWQHVISVFGDQVVHYDYPLLVPTKLVSRKIATFPASPAFATQSPSQRYLVMSSPNSFTTFYMYDLTNPSAAPVVLNLPAGLITTASVSQSWKVIGWADDNQHLLLEHLYDGTQEFIEVDTANPSQSLNLNRTFNVTPTAVTFNNLKFNQFYFYDATSETLSAATIGSPLTQVATSVVAYKSYQNNTLIYATTAGAPSGDVAVDLSNSGSTYFVRDLPLAQTYLLDMAGYNGNDYAVVGDSSTEFVYIYQNPLGQVTGGTNAKILPFRALQINAPDFEQFAPTAQFILVENGSSVAIYDILNDTMYHYTLSKPLDAPQQHVYWMDGDRLDYVSSSSVNIIDYDNTNRQVLTSALPQYPAFFAPNYQSYFTLSLKNGQVELEQTSLIAS
jgi:hypothetical protein